MQDFVVVLLPILVAGVTTYVFDGLKYVSAKIDNLPALFKQVAVAMIAVALTKVSVALGVQLGSTELAGLSPDDISALLSAGIAYLFHAGKQAKAIREGK